MKELKLIFLVSLLSIAIGDESSNVTTVEPITSPATTEQTTTTLKPPQPTANVTAATTLATTPASTSTTTLSSTTESSTVKTSTSTTQLPTTSSTTMSTSTSSTTSTTTTMQPTTTTVQSEKLQEEGSSLSIFFVLCVIALGILLIHFMLQTQLLPLPESIVTICLGALIGFFLKFTNVQTIFEREEVFSPTAFFLVLLPPIIFESGYNLHKGNFFQNIGSIVVFAIFGTIISALVIGCGCWFLGVTQIIYRLDFKESFAFGSLISAVDPVATIAIFHALKIDPVLNMLVFGESILNDAVSIVLTTIFLPTDNVDGSEAFLSAVRRFCMMFFASAGIGAVFALIVALLLKYIDLRKNPSLEFALLLVFTYCPYALAEGCHLSGIMAILFNGIVMSHYSHFNLSTVTQITMQQTMRTLSFICETCVFAYLGLAIFSFKHSVKPSFVISSIMLCLIGRAANIFPLSWMVNKFRATQITPKMSFIMWFSGLRGSVSYALALHLEYSDEETRRTVITTTLIIVLFTTIVFGGSTLPLMKFLQATKKTRRTRSSQFLISSNHERFISLSKTKEWGQAIDSEHLSELTEDDEANPYKTKLTGFAKLDIKYFIPFFTRRFTNQELRDCKSQMAELQSKWYSAIRIDNQSDDEEIFNDSIDTHHSQDSVSTATMPSNCF